MSGTFSKIKQIFHLLKTIDFEQFEKIATKVDIPKLMDGFSKLDDKQLQGLMKIMDPNRPKKKLPPIDGDF